jgi:hypothetical protein
MVEFEDKVSRELSLHVCVENSDCWFESKL